MTEKGEGKLHQGVRKIEERLPSFWDVPAWYNKDLLEVVEMAKASFPRYPENEILTTKAGWMTLAVKRKVWFEEFFGC